MTSAFFPGLSQTLSLQLNEALLATSFAPHISGLTNLPPAFATALLVGFMEWSCIEALKPCLADGQNTVGTSIYLGHVAPTLKGMSMATKLTAQVELMEVKGHSLRFRVNCYDACHLIGWGFHERTVIDTVRLMAKVSEKAQRIAISA